MREGEDAGVGLRQGVDDAIKMLSVKLLGRGPKVVNGVPCNALVVPQRFIRSVPMGALLASCDQPTVNGMLQISLKEGLDNGSTPIRLAFGRCPAPG